jgi:Na+/proline symporter
MSFLDLSFREKSAWAMGALFLVITLAYLVDVQPISWRSGEAPPVDRQFVKVMIATIVGSIVVQSLLAARHPKEADAPADERERLALARAGNIAGSVLGVGSVAALWNYLVHANGNLLFHGILLSLLLSTIAEYALQILFFRRGA